MRSSSESSRLHAQQGAQHSLSLCSTFPTCSKIIIIMKLKKKKDLVLTEIRQVVNAFKRHPWECLGSSAGYAPTLGFESGHDLTVHEFEPQVWLCTDNKEPAWDSFIHSFMLALCLSPALSLKNKHLKINKIRGTWVALSVKGRTLA